MKATKKLTAFALALIFAFAFCIAKPQMARADDSGILGTSVTYSFVESTGTLTISGTEDMPDYPFASEQPWYNYSSNITAIIVEEKAGR